MSGLIVIPEMVRPVDLHEMGQAPAPRCFRCACVTDDDNPIGLLKRRTWDVRAHPVQYDAVCLRCRRELALRPRGGAIDGK